MTFYLVIFVILIIHFSFFLQLYITGETQISFFGWISQFNYPIDIANKCFIYICISTLALCIGYMLTRNKKKSCLFSHEICNKEYLHHVRVFFKYTCVFQIFISLYVIFRGQFSYHLMTGIRGSINFLFELRIFPILSFIYILQFITKNNYRRYKTDIILFGLLLISFVFVQARSLLFESGTIMIFYFLKARKNKIKFKYILILYLLSILPNIVVLGRLSSTQADLSSFETWKNIFTYEYTILSKYMTKI